MSRRIIFTDEIAQKSRIHQNANAAGRGGAPHSENNPGAPRPLNEELHKERPEPVYIPGQGLSVEARKRNQPGTLRYGYERLGHMYSLRIPVKFEELQGRHPFDYVEETREHYRLHPDPVKKPAQPEDLTLFDIREWLEPLIRKGQVYFDYCRDKWLEKESKLGATCAPICCMYSLWSITDSCLQYGGFVFMAVYLILTLVFIIPLIYMELAIGQFHRQGLVKAIKQTCPLFQGLAYLMLISCLFDYLLSMTRITWLFYYLLSAVYKTFPWRDCDHDWTTSHCKEATDHHQASGSFTGMQRTPSVEWYRVHVSRPWSHWRITYQDPHWHHVAVGLLPEPRILISFIFLLFLIRALMKLWCRPLGRFMHFIFYAAFLLSGFSLLTFSHTFPTDIFPVVAEWLFRSDHMKHFYSKNAWAAAVRHAVIGSGVGTGIYVTYGNHNTFPHDELKCMSVLSGLTSYLVHCMVAFFFILCHFTIRTTVIFSSAAAVNYGYDIIFEVFPQVAAQHHQQGIGYLMFTAMTLALLLYASLRVISSLHTIRQYFFDRDKGYYEPIRVSYNYWEHDKMKRQQRHVNLQLGPQRKGQLITKIMLMAGVFHLATFLPGGSAMLFVTEAFWYNCIPLFILMIECVAIIFFAGIRTVNEYIRKMTTWQVTIWYRFMWKIIVPLILMLYVTHPQQRNLIINEVETNDMVDFLGHLLCVLPFFIMFLCVMNSWRRSRARNCGKKLLLEASPEHEHAGMIAGHKPSTRLHWMHHLHVPCGFSRGACLPSYEGPPRKPNIYRFYWQNLLLNFLWYTLKFKWVNKIKDGCIEYEDPATKFFHMFPPIPYPVKPPKTDKPIPDYLPNQAIKRVHKLKKYKDFSKQRKSWLNEKVDLERERMAADHDERDIEAGIIALSAAARQAQAEDEEHEFFDMFDVSTGEEVFDTDTSSTTPDSWELLSDDGGNRSSASVSTSDSFDSQNSLFLRSGEEGESSWKAKNLQEKESDSSSDGENNQDDEMGEIGLEDSDDYGAPAMDYGGDEDLPIPFDDDTDSWELEELEHFEDDRGYDYLDKETSEAETDTDGLMEALEESNEGSSENDDEGNSEDDAGEEEDEGYDWGGAPGHTNKKISFTKGEAKHAKKKESSSEESESWSSSCGTGSSCSSSDNDESSSSNDDDEGERKIRAASYESQEEEGKSSEAHRRRNQSGGRNARISFFRTIAERLDNFLHISQKKEKERIPVIHKAVEKQKREEKLHDKEMDKIK